VIHIISVMNTKTDPNNMEPHGEEILEANSAMELKVSENIVGKRSREDDDSSLHLFPIMGSTTDEVFVGDSLHECDDIDLVDVGRKRCKSRNVSDDEFMSKWADSLSHFIECGKVVDQMLQDSERKLVRIEAREVALLVARSPLQLPEGDAEDVL
jgi:hypothetical protein